MATLTNRPLTTATMTNKAILSFCAWDSTTYTWDDPVATWDNINFFTNRPLTTATMTNRPLN